MTRVSITFSSFHVTVSKEDKEPRELPRREENQRIFYVTLTRAKSLIVLPDSLRLYNKSKDSFADLCRLEGSGWEDLFDAPRPIVSPG